MKNKKLNETFVNLTKMEKTERAPKNQEHIMPTEIQRHFPYEILKSDKLET